MSILQNCDSINDICVSRDSSSAELSYPKISYGIFQLHIFFFYFNLSRIKDQLVESERGGGGGRSEKLLGYQNGAFNSGELGARPGERSVDGDRDLARLGYTVYSGAGGRQGAGENIPLDNVR